MLVACTHVYNCCMPTWDAVHVACVTHVWCPVFTMDWERMTMVSSILAPCWVAIQVQGQPSGDGPPIHQVLCWGSPHSFKWTPPRFPVSSLLLLCMPVCNCVVVTELHCKPSAAACLFLSVMSHHPGSLRALSCCYACLCSLSILIVYCHCKPSAAMHACFDCHFSPSTFTASPQLLLCMLVLFGDSQCLGSL